MSGHIFATKACIDNRKKVVKQLYLLHMCDNMVNFGLLTAEICWRVSGIPANFNRFRVLASLLHRHRSTESTTLCRMFGRLLAWYKIYTFWGLLPPNGILPAAKFTLRPSLAVSYIGSVTARHSSSGRQPNQTLWRGTRNGITQLSQRAPPIFCLLYTSDAADE